jgi:hypothetical protein
MNDYVFEGFLSALRKKKSKARGITIKPLDFENFSVATKGKSKLDLVSLHDLWKWAGDTLKTTAHQINFFLTYHPDSHRYWLKNVGDKDEEGNYCVSIDLEEFIESKKRKEQKARIESMGSFIPDNYELAKRVMQEFTKIPENKKYKIEDQAFRECANWVTKDKEAAEALGKFVHNKYVEPTLKHLYKINNIEKVKFKKSDTQETVDFVYKKTKSKI